MENKYTEQNIWNLVFDKTNLAAFSGQKTNIGNSTEKSSQEILNIIYDEDNHRLK